MSKAPYTFAVLSDANLTMYPSFVAPTTVGPRVTSAADLTEGKWYAMFTNACNKPTVIHAQYKGENGAGYHEFLTADDDYHTIPALSRILSRRDKSLASGLSNDGQVFHIYKFKQRRKAPVSTEVKSPYDYQSTCRKHGIKEGDKFAVVEPGHYRLQVGTIVTLTRDDGSNSPYFSEPNNPERTSCHLWRLAPVTATGRRLANGWPEIPSVPKAANQSNTSTPAPVLGPIDQLKSEIDALNAQKQIKQEEIDKLTKDVATIGGEVDKLKQKVADSLKEYLPEPKKPIW